MNYPLRNELFRFRQNIAARNWNGQGPAPHPIKQRMVRSYAAKHGLRIFVETGTYYGDMISAVADDFDLIYSIELSRDLHRKAQKRLRHHANIKLLCGDSASELERIVQLLRGPALFWLDAHYSAGVTARGTSETPVMQELAIIRRSSHRNVILVDDARVFGSDPAYPLVAELGAVTRIENDAIVIEP